MIQKEAYENLEGALTGDVDNEQQYSGESSAMKKKSISPVKNPGSDQKGGRPKTAGSNSYTPQNAK